MTNESGGQTIEIVEFIQKALPILGAMVVCVVIIVFLVCAILRVVNYRRKLKQKSVLLEITPPAFQDKVPIATAQLFSVFHGLLKNRSLTNILLRYAPSFSLEIVSSKDQGIRYLIRVDQDSADIMRHNIQAYITDAKVEEVDDYLHEAAHSSLQVFKQANHFAHPIDTNKAISEHDPVAYLTNAMTKLDDDELMSFQMVVTPASIAEAAKIDLKIRQGYWSGSSLEKSLSGKKILRILWIIIKFPFVVMWGMLYAFFTHEMYDSPKSRYNSPEAARVPPAEQELLDEMHVKLSQDLFYADLRLLVLVNSKQHLKERARTFAGSLATYATPNWQMLKQSRNYLFRYGYAFRHFVFRNRLPSLVHANSSILSTDELGALFHFPHTRAARTDNVSKSLSKTLPAPTSLKDKKNKLSIVLGQNKHQGQVTPFGLTEAERERHIFMIDGTDNGKTTMLQYGIVQDIQSGKGVAVIDPHGDLAITLLRYIPEDRIKDVIYFNPDDIDHPLAMNLLELPKGLKGSALEREKDRVTESVISVLRKIFSDDDTGGHRIEYVLRNAIQTALTTEDPTIFTIFELLTNDSYRKQITNNLPAGTLKNFWQNELGKAGAMQRVKMSHGVTSKIGRFEFSPATKRVMGRSTSTLDFDNLLSSGKILICNFSKGNLGEDTSALFGTAVLAKLQTAALRRARIDQRERTPFYLYVDEFQNFATMPFVQMLSEARKYKLFLTMAEQSTTQQDEQRLVNIILANVGTVITFRTGSPVDEQLVLPLFKPYIEPGEIANLPSFNFYARLSAIKSQEPLSGETLLLDDDGDEAIAKKAITSSRKLYAYKYESETTKQKPSKAVAKTKTDETKDTAAIDPREDEPIEV